MNDTGLNGNCYHIEITKTPFNTQTKKNIERKQILANNQKQPSNFAVNILGVVGYYYNTNIAECIIKIKSKPSE